MRTLRMIRVGGYGALVVPGGLYGGANASALRQHLLDEGELCRLLGLINTKRGWFKEVDIDRFAAFAAKRGGRTSKFLVQFGLAGPEDLANQPVEMDANVIRRLSPETYAIPDVRDLSQLVISGKMYSACPAFGDTSLGLPVRHYSRELDMGSDRDLFTTDPSGLAVYEGRMIDHFDHRAKTYESGHGNSAVWIERDFGNPKKAIAPQWRVLRENLPSKLGDRCDKFRIGFGDVANPRNERSFTATLIPPGVICGHKVPTFIFDAKHEWAYLPWLAVANSFSMDWLARCRLNAPTMSYTLLDGLPFPRPALSDSFVQRVAPIVLRLLCTTTEMALFWNRMAKLGLVETVEENTVPPSALIESEPRALARAELDAIIAIEIFGLDQRELSEILDTFDVLRRREEKAYHEFRTKRLILEAYKTLRDGAPEKPPRVIYSKQVSVPTPTWMDRPLDLPTSRRVALASDRYRAAVIPHLLYQAGGSLSFDRFRKAYWLLTEPKMLERYGSKTVGEIARKWSHIFGDTLQKEMFIEHLKGAVGRQLHFITKNGERWLELRDPKVADDDHVIFDARLALLVADLWPVTEPITPLAPADEIILQELASVL